MKGQRSISRIRKMIKVIGEIHPKITVIKVSCLLSQHSTLISNVSMIGNTQNTTKHNSSKLLVVPLGELCPRISANKKLFQWFLFDEASIDINLFASICEFLCGTALLTNIVGNLLLSQLFHPWCVYHFNDSRNRVRQRNRFTLFDNQGIVLVKVFWSTTLRLILKANHSPSYCYF